MSDRDALGEGRGLSKVYHVDTGKARAVVHEQQGTANQLQKIKTIKLSKYAKAYSGTSDKVEGQPHVPKSYGANTFPCVLY